jgi:hypothetical protein
MRRLALLLVLGGCSSPSVDPLAPLQPDPDALTDVSADLDAVLEQGSLAGACDRWRAGATDRRSRLLCGKQMFFYESFGTAGVPTAIPQFLIDHFPDEIGPGFSQQGMIADPSSPTHLPLGLAPTTKLNGQIDAVAFTCASCHFARLPDGRYAVGAPNHAYQYGKQILSMVVFPLVALTGGADSHDPQAIELVKPLLDRADANPQIKNDLLNTLLPLASGGMMPGLTMENEHHYATWPPGTMDFVIQPLPIDDTVHTVSKISAIWSIPPPDELASEKLSSDWLGFTGAADSVMMFLHGFVVLGGNPNDWADEDLQPLADYVHSLRPPANPVPPANVARGRVVFDEQGCRTCHDGPRGMGRRLYDYSEIGTDAAMLRWLDPTLTNTPCCNLPPNAVVNLTHKLKSPRLAGEWAVARVLHDGALDSLEQLLCLEPRPDSLGDAMDTTGHTYGCDLPAADRAALLDYLRN